MWCTNRQWCPVERFSEGRSTCSVHLQQAVARRRKRTRIADRNNSEGNDAFSAYLDQWLDEVFSTEIVDDAAGFDHAVQTWRAGGAVDFNAITECLEHSVDASGPHTAAALYMLGVCYMNGLGRDQDQTKAVQLWQQAFELGFLHAEFVLACCSLHGVATPVDVHTAHQGLAHVAAQQHAGVTLLYENDVFKLQVHPSYTRNNQFSHSFPCICGDCVTQLCQCSSNSSCDCIITGHCKC